MSKGSSRRLATIKEQEETLRWELFRSDTSSDRKKEILDELEKLARAK